jgi:lipid II:glycine glycyltransferase (peptidoglycan interpeptide bridge formation enzyme)
MPGLKIHELSASTSAGWNDFVAVLRTGHILQSFEWGEFKTNYGWKPIRLLFERKGVPCAVAQVLRRRVPLAGGSILYVPKGPCFDPADQPTLKVVLYTLKELAKRERAIFIRIDPDVAIEDQDTLATLVESGFRPSPEQIQYRNTMIIDLRPTLDQLRSRLRKDARYNINLARRRGITIADGGIPDLPLFYEIYAETSRRDRFLIRPFNYYAGVWKLFLERGMAKLLFAKYEGETLAGAMLLMIGGRVWYMYGASRDIHRNLKPNHLLQWEAMTWAKSQGAVSYDMWGLPNILQPGQPMWGVVEFKKSFGGEIHRWIGAYDFVAKPVLYRLFTQGLPRYLALLRRLRGLPSAEATGE